MCPITSRTLWLSGACVDKQTKFGKYTRVNMSMKTMFITQEGPANALALNKDNSQVVIAGRNGNHFLFNYNNDYSNYEKNANTGFLQSLRFLRYWKTNLKKFAIYVLVKIST